MSAVEEIEMAIMRLSPDQYSNFRGWLKDYENEMWDKEMVEDAQAGRFDSFAAEILNDLNNDHCIHLWSTKHPENSGSAIVTYQTTFKRLLTSPMSYTSDLPAQELNPCAGVVDEEENGEEDNQRQSKGEAPAC